MRPSALKATEEYYRWEETPGVRYRNTFYVSRFTAPGLHRLETDTADRLGRASAEAAS
ncbi:hypothetical protein [Rhodococcus sp. ABRD24]|uniref:hypothetical protein n=1 Tax=Rhodococcus sp. ABRD24 TaxID=2507582 RepID=UPI0013F14E6A|nr:hypothetical protein [Rhodococcus sp. ABRD24]